MKVELNRNKELRKSSKIKIVDGFYREHHWDQELGVNNVGGPEIC